MTFLGRWGVVFWLFALGGCTTGVMRSDTGVEPSIDNGPDGHGLDVPLVDVRSDAGGDRTSFDAFDGVGDGPIFVDADCGAVYSRHDVYPGAHVPLDAGITWSTNPPSSGDHYDAWARWGIHREVVPRGYWVHNLEHGGVVVLYRCDGECDSVRDALESFVRGLRPEPECMGTGVVRRILLTPDPLLDVPVAAAAWGWTYRAYCVDVPSLEAFVYRLTGQGPENVCADGSYPP